jgi:hypothetical protein
MRNSSKHFFGVCFTSFDRVRVADHEKQLFTLRKYFIQIQHQKLSLGELLSRLKTPTSFHSGPPNRTECDAYKSFLYTYQVFLHNR